MLSLTNSLRIICNRGFDPSSAKVSAVLVFTVHPMSRSAFQTINTLTNKFDLFVSEKFNLLLTFERQAVTVHERK